MKKEDEKKKFNKNNKDFIQTNKDRYVWNEDKIQSLHLHVLSSHDGITFNVLKVYIQNIRSSDDIKETHYAWIHPQIQWY